MKPISLFVFIVFLLLAFAGCHVNKQVTKTETKIDSSAYYRKQAETYKAERDQYERRVNELEYFALTFVECPDTDSLRAAILASGGKRETLDSVLAVLDSYRAEIKRNADGSIEARGRIAGLTQSKSKLEEVIAIREQKIAELRDSVAAKKVEIRTVEKTRDVERDSGRWWLWLLPVTAVLTLILRGKLLKVADWWSDRRARLASQFQTDKNKRNK